MASTQALCTSFKKEILTGTHNLINDTIKVALYSNTATLGSTTTEYTPSEEITNTGTYVATGSIIAFEAPNNTGTSVFVGPASSATLTWTGITAPSIQSCLVYNSTKANKAISIHTFTNQNITAGSFTITFPVNDSTTGLIRLD